MQPFAVVMPHMHVMQHCAVQHRSSTLPAEQERNKGKEKKEKKRKKRKEKKRQDKTRQDKTRQDKTRKEMEKKRKSLLPTDGDECSWEGPSCVVLLSLIVY